MPSDGRRVIVVGGGVAGITAALTLAERGVPVLLCEQNALSLGGRAAAYPATTFEHRGVRYRFSMEHGIHGWWRQYRNFNALIERSGLSRHFADAEVQTLIHCERGNTWITNIENHEGRLAPPEPIHDLHLLLKPNVRRLMRLGELPSYLTLARKVLEACRFDPGRAADRAHYDKLSVADYLQGMPLFFRAFLRSLNRNGFFAEPPSVSLWAFLVGLQLYVFLRKDGQCYAFPDGPINETVISPLAERITQHGGTIALGVNVEAIEAAANGWRIAWQPTLGAGPPAALDGQPRVLEAADLIVAVDAPAATRLCQSSPPLAAAYGDISVFVGRPAINVRLFWTRSPRRECGSSGVFSGRATANNFFWLHRFQSEFASWQAATGGAVSECHVYSPDHLHELSDDEVIARVQRDMERAFPELTGSSVHAVLIRNPATHTNFPVGCAGSFPRVESPWPSLALSGDWIDGDVAVLYMERACQTGLRAANHILRRRGYAPATVLRPLPPPPHVRLLQAALRAPERLWRRG